MCNLYKITKCIQHAFVKTKQYRVNKSLNDAIHPLTLFAIKYFFFVHLKSIINAYIKAKMIASLDEI